MIASIADFISGSTESGVSLALQDENGFFLFFLAGTRHIPFCPKGEIFFAGIGGHLKEGEDWLTCARREAKEEIGTDIEILSSQKAWYVSQNFFVKLVEFPDRPRPYALYKHIHQPGVPRAGESYHILIYEARIYIKPKDFPKEELQGIIGLTPEQLTQSLDNKPTLSELVNDGALFIGGEHLDGNLRLYPLGTSKALAHIFRYIDSL